MADQSGKRDLRTGKVVTSAMMGDETPEDRRSIRLWVDDVRLPPSDDYRWVMTAEDALQVMLTEDVSSVSLDCDLDLRQTDRGTWVSVPANDGIWLVKKMIEHDLLPPRIRHIHVHSQNPEGGPIMKQMLYAAIRKKRGGG